MDGLIDGAVLSVKFWKLKEDRTESERVCEGDCR